MLIRVINPNTTASMTALIGRAARAAARPGTVVEAVNPGTGPVSIESHYDEALAVPGVLAEIARGERDGASGYVVACFGDPGLEAARELATVPVIGIAEAGMHAAAFLGRGFSVVTTLSRTTGRAWDLARGYGFAERCRGVHSCEIPVLDLETDPAARSSVTEQCRRAVAVDASDAVVLGCAGMADLCAGISAAIGVPVVDGVSAATAFAESLAVLGLSTGKRGEFATPGAKPYTGVLSPWSLLGAARAGG